MIEVREIVPPDFDALEFVLHCARRGSVELDGRPWTLLTAPMAGFYSVPAGVPNPGVTQMRIAYVETPEHMKMVPDLLATLLSRYLSGYR